MKMEDFAQVKRLAADFEKTEKWEQWASGFPRYEPAVQVRTDREYLSITLTFAEIDAIIARYRSDLEKRAAELGVDL